VSGLLFAFAVVVMPGIRNLNDKEFIRTFQVIDKVIQNNQPIFMLAWVGSIFSFIAAIVFSFAELNTVNFLVLILALMLYLLGVQLPTITINIPLNNRIQTLVVDSMEETELKEARKEFETKWNKWNIFRSVISSLTSVLLMIILLKS
jgi:uncharacterized membrane protein